MKFFIMILPVLFFSSCLNLAGDRNSQVNQNEETIQNYFDAMNEGDTSLISTLMADDFVRHSGGVADQNSKAEMLEFLYTLKENNPGFHFHADHIAAGKNKVGVFWTAHSESNDGKNLKWTGSHMLLLNDDGLIHREYIVGDRLGMMEQLGYKMVKPDEEEDRDDSKIHPGLE